MENKWITYVSPLKLLKRDSQPLQEILLVQRMVDIKDLELFIRINLILEFSFNSQLIAKYATRI